MAHSQGPFILIVLAYLFPVLLAGVLMYLEGSKFQALAEKPEPSEELKAFEILIKSDKNFTAPETIQVLESVGKLVQRDIVSPSTGFSMSLTAIITASPIMYYIALGTHTATISDKNGSDKLLKIVLGWLTELKNFVYGKLGFGDKPADSVNNVGPTEVAVLTEVVGSVAE